MGMDGFVKVQGKNLVLDGKPVLFHGLGLGSWLNLEHLMLGLPTTDSLIRRAVKEVFGVGTAEQFFKGLETEFITEEDFRFLADAGIDLLGAGTGILR